ncbi:MAG: leucine-rich repeat domain-containing protein [Promethearchaeota archaeon]
MNIPFTSEEIEHYFREKLITKEETHSILNTFIENCDSERIRAKFLNVFANLAPKKEDTFKVLENCLISDESPLVRSTAVRNLLVKFPKFSLMPLRYLIHNEKSIIVLKTLLELLEDLNNQYSFEIKKELINKLAKCYQVVPEESKFLLEIESEINRNSDINFCKPVIKNNHVTALDFVGQKLKHIPNSIGSVSKLQYLNLWDNNLTTLPKSIERLSNLKYLFLDWNKFIKFPTLRWDKLISLEKLSITNNFKLKKFPDSLFSLIKQNFINKYVNEGVVLNEAIVLGLLEILTGMKLRKLTNNKIPKLYACDYRISSDGHITGIYLYGYHSFQINLIPKQICKLEQLEELILRDQNIENIPECIINLKSLKRLDLLQNDIRYIPNYFKELHGLELLDLGENKIRKIPESLKLLKLDIWL